MIFLLVEMMTALVEAKLLQQKLKLLPTTEVAAVVQIDLDLHKFFLEETGPELVEMAVPFKTLSMMVEA